MSNTTLADVLKEWFRGDPSLEHFRIERYGLKWITCYKQGHLLQHNGPCMFQVVEKHIIIRPVDIKEKETLLPAGDPLFFEKLKALLLETCP
jgi:hypothetical protein